MRIIHFGDIHYEEAKHRRQGADGVDEGWWDIARAVDQIADRAIEANRESGGVVAMFGGDLARSRKPSPQTYAHFAGVVARMKREGIDTIAIPGNHDIASNGEANALEPLTAVPGFHLFNEPAVAYIAEPGPHEYQHVRTTPHVKCATAAAVVMVPWMQRGVAAGNVEPGTSLESLLEQMGHAITAIIRQLAADPIAAGIPTFLAYHGTVMGGETATGQLAHLFHEPVLSAIDLGNIGLVGVMLNHLHKRQDIAGPTGCSIVYSSSVERLTFGDENDTKGWVEWSVPTDGGPAPYIFGDTDARPFVTVTQLPEIGGWDVEGAIVRVRLSADAEYKPDERDLEEVILAAGAHRVTEVVIETEDARVEHAAADVAKTDPLEALADWLTAEHPDDVDLAREALAAAALLVLGEDPAVPVETAPVETAPVDEPALELAPAV